MKEIFRGSGVALITPFKDGGLDEEALDRLLEFQLEQGTDAVVVLGTTGEPSTMTEDEKVRVIKAAVSALKGKIPVLVGTGGNNTRKVIADSLRAQELGADALLVVTPYYNKCTQNGLIAHYAALAEAVSLPIVVYNVPGRTGVNVLPATLEKLADLPNIAAVKEASGNIDQICEVCRLLRGRMAVYSGDDGLTYPMIGLGASGVISVTANVIPAFMKDLCRAAFAGKAEALTMHEKLLPFAKAMFCEVNPIPVKALAAMMGLCSGELRLPLTPAEPASVQKIREAAEHFGVFSGQTQNSPMANFGRT